MQRPRHHFLASSRFPDDQYGRFHGRRAIDEGKHLLHRGAFADDVAVVPPLAQLTPQSQQLLPEAFVLEHLSHLQQQFFGIQGLGQIGGRPCLDRIHRLRDRPIARHQHDGRPRMVLHHPTEQFPAIHFRHHQVRQNQIGPRRQRLHRLLAIRCGLHVIPLIAQHAGHRIPHRRVVLDQQNMKPIPVHCSLAPSPPNSCP
jgi:hypothetical protein